MNTEAALRGDLRFMGALHGAWAIGASHQGVVHTSSRRMSIRRRRPSLAASRRVLLSELLQRPERAGPLLRAYLAGDAYSLADVAYLTASPVEEIARLNAPRSRRGRSPAAPSAPGWSRR